MHPGRRLQTNVSYSPVATSQETIAMPQSIASRRTFLAASAAACGSAAFARVARRLLAGRAAAG
jgi:hypothetical protein